MQSNTWNTTLYDRNHAFVWQFGESVLEDLTAKPGERILDLGCGTGHLTAKIAALGAIVFGIDADSHMIQQAQKHYPTLNFEVADARNFEVSEPMNAVFSNAVLHWILEPETVIQSIYNALKPGGRFVAEFGGKGNIQSITQALFRAIEMIGFDHTEILSPWYFPSIAEYADLLEQQGFEVQYARLFDRPTPLDGGESGMANWLRMFANGILSNLSLKQQAQVIQSVEAQLRSTLYQNGQWIADYRRIRIVACKRE